LCAEVGSGDFLSDSFLVTSYSSLIIVEFSTKFRHTIGTLCTTVSMLRVLVTSHYWKAKRFYDDEGNNEMVKAIIESLLCGMRDFGILSGCVLCGLVLFLCFVLVSVLFVFSAPH
jgi:hypothetical protein